MNRSIFTEGFLSKGQKIKVQECADVTKLKPEENNAHGRERVF